MAAKVSSEQAEVRVREIFTLLALAFLAFATRWTWRSEILYHWDSVQFALALDDFDLAHNQPQPPGYLLYVLLGRAVRFLFGVSDNTALVVLSLAFSIFGALLLFRLGEAMFSYKRGWIAALLFLFSPLIWFYGLTALLHLGSGMFALMVALWGYRAMVPATVPGAGQAGATATGAASSEPTATTDPARPNGNYIYLSALALGFLGAFRQQDAVFLFPLWAWCAWWSGWKRIPLGILLMAVPALGFLFATIQMAGGYQAWRAIMDGYQGSAFNETSILLGAGFGGLVHNGERILRALMVLIAFAVFLPGLRLLPRRDGKPSRSRQNLLFLLVWILPGLLFFLLVHMGQPGLLHFLSPGILLLLVWAIPSLTAEARQRAQIVLVFVLVLNAAAFLAMPPARTLFGRDIDWFPFLSSIREREAEIAVRVERLQAMEAAEVTTIGTGYYFRHASYYLPDYRVVQIGQILEAAPDTESVTLNTSHDRQMQYLTVTMQPNAQEPALRMPVEAMILWDETYLPYLSERVQMTEIKPSPQLEEVMVRIRTPGPGQELAFGRGLIDAVPVEGEP